MAEELGATLAPTLPPDVRLVSSPSRRARQTAAAIAAHLDGARVEIDERWLETDVGLAEGLTFDEVAVRWPELAASLLADDVAIDWPAGETAIELECRIGEAWSSLVAAGRPTVVVSHAGSIRVAIALATGRGPSEIEFLAPGSWVSHDIPGPAPGVAPTAQQS